MSGYNRLEQTVGDALTRYPRVKSLVQAVYQRASYYAFADRAFEYDLHEDATLHSAAEWAGVDDLGPHVVGFYDVCPWNEAADAYLVHQLPDDPGDPAAITVLRDGEAHRVASARAWNYQQGSRTQWHPTCEDAVLFNDVRDGSTCARFVALDGDADRTFSRPLQAVNPTGDDFLSIDYRRLDRNSPGYGYGTDDGSSLRAPDADGVVRVDLDDGETELVVPLSDLRSRHGGDVPEDRHYLHHLLYAPDGERFAFLHRWKDDADRRHTRLYVAARDGELRLLSANRYLSHFCWLDERRLFLYGGTDEDGRGYYVVDTASGDFEYVDALDGYGDGHPSLSPDGRWIVTDTYPDRVRKRTLTLYDLESGETVRVGEFLAPFEFDGVKRCDLHPRWSPDGQFVSVDSAHSGQRASFVIDVSAIVS